MNSLAAQILNVAAPVHRPLSGLASREMCPLGHRPDLFRLSQTHEPGRTVIFANATASRACSGKIKIGLSKLDEFRRILSSP
jgi:hypothetical protein